MRFIELFAGIGGFRLGLEKSNRQQQEDTEACRCRDSVGNKGKQPDQPKKWGNYTCVWSNELDKYACQIYRKHYREICEQDIGAVDPSTIPEHDLITAGFPCQSFSIAGKRGGFKDTRGTLFFEICRIARAKRTPYLLLENVKGLLSHDNGDTFQTIIGTLDELGYDCQWQVLNSKDFGVPQNRERVFIIGHLRGQPRPKVFPIRETNGIHTETDGEISHAIDSNYHKGWLDNQQRTMILQGGVRTRGKIRQYENEVPAMAQAYGTGGGNVPMIFNVYNQALRANQELAGTLKGEGVADTSLGTALIKNQRIRRLTPIECEHLQGFPDNWTKGISDTQRYKCLGNAVTTNVIEAIGRQWGNEVESDITL